MKISIMVEGKTERVFMPYPRRKRQNALLGGK